MFYMQMKILDVLGQTCIYQFKHSPTKQFKIFFSSNFFLYFLSYIDLIKAFQITDC